METNRFEEDFSRDERGVQWATGLKAAFGIAAILWLVTRGIPWASSGLVSPTVMGRELKDPGEINARLAGLATILHFVAGMLYASLMMPLIHRFPFSTAWLIGGTMGAILILPKSRGIFLIWRRSALRARTSGIRGPLGVRDHLHGRLQGIGETPRSPNALSAFSSLRIREA